MQRVAIDAGGTFTDVAILNEHGHLSSHKVLSHPDDPARGMLRALDSSIEFADVGTIVNGTTAGLNAVLARSGTRVLGITNDGFKDILQIGRAERSDVWQLRYRPPTHLVPPEDIHTVKGRILASGEVSEPLSVEDLRAISDCIAINDIQAVAVCLLHATANPAHELQVRDFLIDRHPDLRVSLSHQVAPEVGEYERFSSTVVSAYVAPTVGNYLSRVTEGLEERTFNNPLYVMRSSGGVTSAESASKRPLQTLLSGPAGGVVGAQVMADALGIDRLLAIDMGGTSLDASVIVDRKIDMARIMDIDRLPILMPVVNLVTISAGGGSVAWEKDGNLHVGPHSAGANPGPACYGQGGIQATVTDANVILGRLGHSGLAEDALKLDVEASSRVFQPLANALKMTVAEVAEAVIDITEARMADALRTLTVRRGHDPREFSLLAFGGAGPLHAVPLAEELGISRVVIPAAPGVFSAWGMLHASIRHDVAESVLVQAEDVDSSELAAIHDRLQSAAQQALKEDGVDPLEGEYLFSADIRYVGQQFSITVTMPKNSPIPEWDFAFRDEYTRTHGVVTGNPAIEFVNVRVSAIGPAPKLLGDDREVASSTAEPGHATLIYQRKEHPAMVCDRDYVREFNLAGPAIIQDSGSTVYVPEGWSASPGPIDTIFLTRNA